MRFVALLLLLATLLFADSDKHEYREHHLPLDMGYLHLTSEQHMQAKTIVRTFKHDYKKFRRQKATTREALSRLFLAEKFDAEEFIRLTTQRNQRAMAIQAEFFAGMHAILTPAQKKRFAKYMEEWEVE